MDDAMKPLTIQQRLQVQPMKHGTGFQAFGVRGDYTLMDPYLMADHYRMSEPMFGPHPHAGFSAVTYMFDDAETGFSNRDSRGDSSAIRACDCHWTVAGAGVVHDEVPAENGKVAHGLQIFVNLAASDKHMQPDAIHILRDEMPRVVQAGGARVKVAFGAYDDGTQAFSAVKPLPSEVTLLDVSLRADDSFRYVVPTGINAFALVISGEINVSGEAVTEAQAVALGRNGGALEFSATRDAQVALFLGKPFDEAVVRHGPFAMTHQGDINRAIADYQAGRMGSL
jgi:redox-sensitive bicupin YhaK (pirin superfamily)